MTGLKIENNRPLAPRFARRAVPLSLNLALLLQDSRLAKCAQIERNAGDHAERGGVRVDLSDTALRWPWEGVLSTPPDQERKSSLTPFVFGDWDHLAQVAEFDAEYLQMAARP